MFVKIASFVNKQRHKTTLKGCKSKKIFFISNKEEKAFKITLTKFKKLKATFIRIMLEVRNSS